MAEGAVVPHLQSRRGANGIKCHLPFRRFNEMMPGSTGKT